MDVTLILVLAVAAGALPLAWLLRSLHQTWTKANMPAFWLWLYQNRRRDRVIRETRKHGEALEVFATEMGDWSEKTDAHLQKLEERMLSLEQRLGQLRQKLQGRGIVTDA